MRTHLPPTRRVSLAAASALGLVALTVGATAAPAAAGVGGLTASATCVDGLHIITITFTSNGEYNIVDIGDAELTGAVEENVPMEPDALPDAGISIGVTGVPGSITGVVDVQVGFGIEGGEGGALSTTLDLADACEVAPSTETSTSSTSVAAAAAGATRPSFTG